MFISSVKIRVLFQMSKKYYLYEAFLVSTHIIVVASKREAATKKIQPTLPIYLQGCSVRLDRTHFRLLSFICGGCVSPILVLVFKSTSLPPMQKILSRLLSVLCNQGKDIENVKTLFIFFFLSLISTSVDPLICHSVSV